MRVKGWHKFQHFKDRRPIWIKLYRDLLDDIEWHKLDSDAAKCLVMMWLIASENDGELPGNEELAFRLRVSEKQLNQTVTKLGHWLEHDDINAISMRYQVDALEKRREETEKETEKETEEETEKDILSGLKKKPDSIPYQKICDDMNCILGTKFRNTDTFKKLIKARVKEGLQIQDFAEVCTKKAREWGSDLKMMQYLRPETLFGTKMNSYLGAHETVGPVSERERINFAAGKQFIETMENVWTTET